MKQPYDDRETGQKKPVSMTAPRPPKGVDGISVESEAPDEAESRMLRARDAHGNSVLSVYVRASMERRIGFRFTVEVMAASDLPPAAKETALGNVADEVMLFLRDALTAARKAGIPVREVMPE